MSNVKIHISHKVALLYGVHTKAGMECLHQLIDDDAYSSVTVLSFQKLKIVHKKLTSLLLGGDDSLHAIRKKIVGDDLFIFQSNYFNKESEADQFVKTNYTVPLRIAMYAKQNTVNQISLLSASTTALKSFFLPHKTRAELEKNMIELDFWSCYIYKPTIIVANDRVNEVGKGINDFISDKVNIVAQKFMNKLSPVPAHTLVSLMIQNAQGLEGGLHMVYNEKIVQFQNDNLIN